MTDSLQLLKTALGQRYDVEREVGSGGMATVYLAQDLRHHRKVAIKVLRPELAAFLGPQRFLREIEVAAQLQHPNILALLDSGDAAGFLYYVMPFVDGPSLRERLAKEGQLPIHEAVKILSEVVDALAEAHRKGIVHRDVKPDNVLLAGRHALVTDFGIAKAVNEATGAHNLTTVGVALGTPAYMAPEQVLADPQVDHRVDLYAVGVMAYEMLTGSLPFTGPRSQAVFAAHLTEEPEPPRARRSSIPPELQEIVLKCLAKQPAQRWLSAEELLAQLETLQAPSGPVKPARWPIGPRSRRRSVATLAGVLLGVVGLITWGWKRNSDRTWLRAEALPHLRALIADEDYEAAGVLARRARRVAPGDNAVAALWNQIFVPASVRSTPPGAGIYVKVYDDTSANWQHLGGPPVDSLPLPRGLKRWRAVAAGYDTLEWAAGPGTLTVSLLRAGTVTAGIVRVPAGTSIAWTAGLSPIEQMQLDEYFLDRYEVTNRQFEAFVDAGGYTRREYWKYPFRKRGRVVAWEAALKEFTDQTGRPGPSTWELGRFPPGQENVPVSGISWYEAAAYCEFVSKNLPTVYHWVRAASVELASSIIPLSNFSGQGKTAVGRNPGMSAFGAYDMAGNVREWQLNASGEQRHALGGAWNDPTYTFFSFTSANLLPAFDRSPENGVRCATYPEGRVPPDAGHELTASYRDYGREKPVTEEVFRVFLNQFAYDPSPLDARTEAQSETAEWRHEMVTFNAAYGSERVMAHLYIPKTGQRPYQTVVYFPGAEAVNPQRFGDDAVTGPGPYRPLFLVQSGLALVFPIYKGTYDRNDGSLTGLSRFIFWPSQTHTYTEYVIQWVKDFKRTVDYLGTRSEFDRGKLVFYGVSWGGRMGAIIPAVDKRVRLSILGWGGLASGRSLPEVDQINYIGRVTVPVLMLNSRQDAIEPLESAQLPMFRMLGTPVHQKRHVVWDGGHGVAPANAYRKEILDWLDRFLGPANH